MIKTIKHRCEGCKYNGIRQAHDGYSFRGCHASGYKGKPVYEIEVCPIGKGKIEVPSYFEKD